MGSIPRRALALTVMMLALVAGAQVARADTTPSPSPTDSPSPSPSPTASPTPTPTPTPTPAPVYVDISGSFAIKQIVRVAENRDWLRVPGSYFHPGWSLTRGLMARALGRAFAPTAVPDPTLTIADMRWTDPWTPFANIAVTRGWIKLNPDGTFNPGGSVNKATMDRALIQVLGLHDAVRGLSKMGSSDGYVFPKPAGFAYLVLAQELHLNYNYPSPNDTKDMFPWEPVPREYFANALSQTANQMGGWAVWDLQRFNTITLPPMNATRKKIVTFALQYVGYPYVYAGAWYRRTFSGYCCGAQAQGGFDCSGYEWWVMQRASSGFPVTNVRPYLGWNLGGRGASDIQHAATTAQRV